MDPAYRREIEAWRAKRLANLTKPDGWLSLAGLFWLEEGENRVGSDPGARVSLPGSAPRNCGRLFRHGESVRWEPSPGLRRAEAASAAQAGVSVSPRGVMDLKNDAEGDPTILSTGTVSFFVIKREERIGVRVKDADSDTRKNFKGLDYFSIDRSWRLEARFEPYDPPKKVIVPTVLGTPEVDVSPGALVFSRGGKTYRLEPVFEQGSDELFLVFGDTTNGQETYGGGRFVYAPMPRDGRTVLDFNKAYSPPCIFTPYATCPLPMPSNRIPIAVAAGEKTYSGAWHHP
jgi:uncharacterized protein (DUF1684 family)